MKQTRQLLRRDRRGFALIVTSVLLSFLVLALVAVLSVARIQSRASVNARNSAVAREHAMVGLNRAIAALQTLAGADQRITAKAEILESSRHENRNWTGVWRPPAMTAPAWLVSGGLDPANFDPQSSLVDGTVRTALQDAVVLVGGNTVDATVDAGPEGANGEPDDAVVVKTVDLEVPEKMVPGLDPASTSHKRIGRFAWWVGDEGVKASITETERQESVNFDDGGDHYKTDSATRARIPQLAQPRQRIEPVFGLAADWYDATAAENLSRVISTQQIEFAGTGETLSELRSRFHDFTAYARGVLADSNSGGLKVDLSNPPGSIDGVLVRFLSLRPDSSTGYVRIGAYPSVSSQPHLRIAPLVTEVRIYATVRAQDTSGHVPVDWGWDIELWNPYNYNLGGPVHLLVENPMNTRFIPDPPGLITEMDWGATISGNEEYSNPITPAVGDPALAFECVIADARLAPGEVQRFSDAGSSFARDTNGDMLDLLPFPGYIVSHSLQSGDPISFVLRDVNGVELGRYECPSNASVQNHSTLVLPPVYLFQRFRLRDGSDTGETDWLQHIDPRGPSVREVTGANDVAHHPFDQNYRSGGHNITLPGLWTDDLFKPGFVRCMFDLPVQGTVSVGTLQHFQFPDASSTSWNVTPFRLGHDWAGSQTDPLGLTDSGGMPIAVDLNSLFDRSFFSTVPLNPAPAWVAGSGPLPNSRIDPYSPDPSTPTTRANLLTLGAARMLVRGAFNINSTSAEAWKALLEGTRIDAWTYEGKPPSDPDPDPDLKRAFFRLPHTAQNIGARYEVNPTASTEWRQGVRDLGNLTNGDMATMATTLAAKVREHGPFASVADFVNDGAVQAAIDSVPSINASVHWPAPTYLTQADLLTAWAPFLQARSDTFLVRAYGEADNPVTGAIEGRAWCEAVVQRVPDLVNASGDITANATGFGRRFKIVQFRWLSPSDI